MQEEKKLYEVTTNPLEKGPLKASLYLTTDFGGKIGVGSEFIADFESEEKAKEICSILNKAMKRPAGSNVWVKAETKPEHNVGVLVFIPGEDNHITSGMWDISNEWVLLDEYRTPEEEVTHWMELPSFPEGYPENEIPSEFVSELKKIAKEQLKDKKRESNGQPVEQKENTLSVFVPCSDDDPRCCGDYTSTDGQSLCYVREVNLSNIREVGEQKEIDAVAVLRWLREEGWEPRNHTGWAKHADNESYYLTDKQLWNEYQKQNKL